MRPVLFSVVLFLLSSCGESSSTENASPGSNNANASNGDESVNDESGDLPDFDAIAARCNTADQAVDAASYECCIERASWSGFVDESWCDDNRNDGYDEASRWVGTGDTYCDVDWMKEIYNNLLEWDPPASQECIDHKLNRWIDYMECSARSYASGCADESTYATVYDLGERCIDEVWAMDGPC